MDAAEDLRLVQQAVSGSEVAIAGLIERLACVPAMLRALNRRAGAPLRPEELQEVEQATLAALWSKLSGFEGRASLETWAYRFTQLELHKALDRRRRLERVHLADEDALAHHAAAQPEDPGLDPATVRECVAQLGAPTSEIIALRHFHDWSFEQIALSRSEALGTVKARYYRGLERLRGLLAPHLRRST